MRELYRYERAYTKIYDAFIYGKYPRKSGKDDGRVRVYPKLSEENKRLFIDFFDLLKSEGLTIARRLKYLNHLPNLVEWHKKPYTKATIESLIKLAGVINEQKYTNTTKKDYLNTVKKIYKVVTQLPKYKGIEPLYFWIYDKRTKFYSTTLRDSENKVKEDFLVEEEVKRIIENAESVRDRAFFALLASQGTRPQEAFTIRKKDIILLENGLQITISGKTGVRTLFIYEKWCTQEIMQYYPTVPETQEYFFDITPRTALNILKKICVKLGINKRVHLYKFRKFAVTQDRIHNVSTHSLEKKFGWVTGTNVIRHYDKSTPLDYMNEMQIKNGIIKKDESPSIFEDKKCLRCGERNPSTNEYCFKCNLKLNLTKEEIARTATDMERRIEFLESAIKEIHNLLKEGREKELTAKLS